MEDAVHSAAVPSRTRSVADRVAERYANAPTYSEILASEARNVARAAQAAADAANDARDAAQAILIGLDATLDDATPLTETASREAGRAQASQSRTAECLPPRNPLELPRGESVPTSRPGLQILEEEAADEGRFDEAHAPIQPLPAKLLEFPRELVAARKARPRLAEGPLREEYDREACQSQLRIFEVEAETISTEPVFEPVMPGWSAIRLDSPPPAVPTESGPRGTTQGPSAARLHSAAEIELPLQTASLEDRLMAGIVDAALSVAGFLVFVLVFVACTSHPPTGKPAVIGAAVALLLFAVVYQLLFFSFGSDTPGMRYAKLALCTFDDENPTRKAMRRRFMALLLSASPLGLGVLWAFFDDDRLGWHDRISRTYQRSYR
jgi:uncharacterized RDD family membrane protein YckC